MFFLPQLAKETPAEGAVEAGVPRKGNAEGSSDEDEGTLIIDEKTDRGGAKRKAGDSVEVSVSHKQCSQFFFYGTEQISCLLSTNLNVYSEH